MKFDLYDKMLDKLYSFADLLLYFLMDSEEYLEGEMYFNLVVRVNSAVRWNNVTFRRVACPQRRIMTTF